MIGTAESAYCSALISLLKALKAFSRFISIQQNKTLQITNFLKTYIYVYIIHIISLQYCVVCSLSIDSYTPALIQVYTG